MLSMRSLFVLALCLAPLLCGCAGWTPVLRDDSWTLFVRDGESVDIARFGEALEPAIAAVEERMGAFSRPVRVHALDPQSRDCAPRDGPATGELQMVPDIGPARVRAYHVRSGIFSLEPSGVFLATSDAATAVHELVHARIADLGLRLPLWFEEGLASYWGDGVAHGGRWHGDGLACWPLRELRDLEASDAELERWMKLEANDDYDSRDNLVAHFLGWAIVFDLAREHPDEGWRAWYERFEREARERGPIAAARARLERTLDRETERRWLDRLGFEDPGARMALAKGLWKLRSPEVVDRMLDALERELDPQVRVTLALNVLLASGETRLGRTRWNRVGNVALPALREGQLTDPREQEALGALYDSMRRWDSRGTRSRDALDLLSRLWEE
ncbi:MAG: hypothetical protein FJ298_02090 [Planctomycetes bacterium]|nr:hypothetical protein [Planctomycetota bacterium]